jgi:hypothetical protein
MSVTGCSQNATPGVAVGVDACRDCNMVIDRPREACGFVRDGEFVTFDSPMCLLRQLGSLREQGDTLPTAFYFADYVDGAMHPAETMTFLLTDHVPTTMGGGVLSFATRESAEAVRVHDDEVLTDWVGFQLALGRPDRVVEVRFDSQGMVPEVVQAVKGELLLLRMRASGLAQDLAVVVKGYPEIGSFHVPASGEEVAFRLRVVRPGAGFPIVREKDGEPLGMLKVSGAHTADEEAM